MAPVIQTLDLRRYWEFIRDFRCNFGIGSGPGASGDVDVQIPNGRVLRFGQPDLYLKETFQPGLGWKPLDRENYAQMGIDAADTMTGWNIWQAVANAPLSPNPDLVRILFVTAEAARSKVIYQICQQLLQSRASAKPLQVSWSQVKPLLNNWGTYTSYNHKRRPAKYGALGPADYYPEKNKDIASAFAGIAQAGLRLDG